MGYGLKCDLPGGSDGKASAYNAGYMGLVPGWGRFPGGGNGYPLQYFYLENSMTEEPEGLWSMDCSLQVHGIFQARVLEWVAISFSRRSS